ncbi:MAG: Lrp/AsnC family transcriptional regulator [Verrucomicrobiota bacterium]
MNAMDDIDKRLLTLIQTEVPVDAHPFASIGAKLGGLNEAEVIARINTLKENRVIRQISAIFDTQSLGYESSLVACQCDPQREDEVAGIISAHPGVSHNYRRDHAFNIWYTLAVAPTSRLGLAGTIEILHRQTGAISTRPLPTLRLFKIGVELDVAGTGKAGDKGAVRYDHTRRQAATPLSELEIRYVRAMQHDLPVTPAPFVAIAGDLGVSLEELQQLTAGMITAGRLRRFSAVLRHRELGFSANGMGIWAVPEADVLRVGEQMAAYRAVTHCYRRPTYPDWLYNVFTMIHARSREECHAVVDQLAHETGITAHNVLFSSKEYKKVRVQYFTEAEAEWELSH